jgi:malonyl-CoA/methylmalonyl-CoA synthetase
VALYAPNSLDWISAYLGVLTAGAVAVMVNPDYQAAELRHIVDDASPVIVVTDHTRAGAVASTGIRVELVDELEPAEPGELPTLGPESPAAILYTSGTTGRPKGAVLDHGNFLAQARGVAESWHWTSGDVLIHALPLFHLHGLGVGLHGSLLAGDSATFVAFSPEQVVEELTRTDDDRGTMFFGVPAMFLRLCDWLDEHPRDLSGVRLFVSGSAPLTPALFERCTRLLGQPPLERYGTTESGVVVGNPYERRSRKPGRIGYPFPGVEVKLGESDELLVKGGQVFSGYWQNEDASRESFTADGFFRTGDIGELDEDGSLAIQGRIKELIITGGFNVYPREVELVLELHPAVYEVAVAGMPSEKWGEEVTAFVVPKSSGTLEESEVIAFAREQLAAYKCPKRVIAVDALPRNAMGKVQRSTLLASVDLPGDQIP